MQEERSRHEKASGTPEGTRRATGGAPEAAADSGLAQGHRWSRRRKMEAVMRLIRGESLDAVSRDLGVEIYRLDEWRQQALAGIEGAFRPGKKDASEVQLEKAQKLLGEAMMENELLREKCRRGKIPLPPGRSRR